MLGWVRPVHQRLHGRQELVRHRAAEAAVGELDDAVLVAALDTAAGEQRAVDAERAELVDDDRDPPAAGVLKQVADERGFPGAEEAGDDGRGDARAHAACSRPGMRPTTTSFRLGALRLGMTVPVAAAA